MAEPAHFDRSSRTRESVAAHFAWFGEVECPQVEARLYQVLCRGIAQDSVLLDLARRAPPTQPPPNLIFASVHYLLLGGAAHRLRDWYPALCDGTPADPDTVFPAFRDFCLAQEDEIGPLIETRLTQTNVVQRCSVLLPAFAQVSSRVGGTPLALIEIGPSAGLNLQWSRFRYAYRSDGDAPTTTWGDPQSKVEVDCALRGERALPPLPASIPVASRWGVDLNPVDVGDPDAVLWLRALIWPEHVARHERLANAIEVARRHPPTLRQGSAADLLPELLEAAPAGAARCVFGTHTLYQFPADALRATLKSMQAASMDRPVYFISVEGTGDRCSELRLTTYVDGTRETELLANCNPHGRWLEWLG